MNLMVNNGQVSVPYAVGISDGEWDPRKWDKVLSPEELTSYFQDWSEESQAIVRCLVSQEKITVFSEWDSGLAPTYARGNMCIMGDASRPLISMF